METLIFLIGVTAILAVIGLAAFVLGWLFTEVVRPVLSFKPFNCRPCLTFWLTVLLSIVYALIVSPILVRYGITPYTSVSVYAIVGVGVLTGLISFFYIKAKFKIYE